MNKQPMISKILTSLSSRIWIFFILSVIISVVVLVIYGPMNIWLQFLALISGFAVIGFVSSLIFKHMFKRQESHLSLRSKFILAFSLVASIPTVLVLIFAIVLFYRSTQMWFDKQITEILDQSSHIAESYLQEHILQLKQSAISLVYDMDNHFSQYLYDSNRLNQILEGQSEFRNLDEAIIFETSSNQILGQTALSFSLAFMNLPEFFLEKADKGEVVEITDDETKIRVLMKLRNHNNIYLLIGRLIDQSVINYINKNNGVIQYYLHFKENRGSLELKFVLAFCSIAVIILLIAIIYGRNFSEAILNRITKLVEAIKIVKDGNLDVRIPQDKNQDEISFLNNSFNTMVIQLDHQKKDLIVAQRAQAWSDIARRVAHEIKNPLTPMQLSAEMLAKKFAPEVSDKERFLRYIDTILRHIRDIGHIISEFVNFAKLPTPRFEKCELVRFVRDIVESRALTGGPFKYNFSSNIETIDFICDTTQMNQIMINLIKNAEEAMESQSSDKKVDIRIEKVNDNVIIKVADTGSGFASEALNKAMDPYFTTRSHGTGLGLAIVKKIVQEHQGNIKIYNELTKGACVEIIFDTTKLAQKLVSNKMNNLRL